MKASDTFAGLVQRPRIGAVLLGLLPFIGMCFSVAWWDRVHPLLLGMPFNMFWLTSWILISSLCLWVAYRLQVASGEVEAADIEANSQ